MIAVSDLRFTYRNGAEPALKGIGFTVEPQEIFGFLGPSGAGKSTTQKILTGLLKGYEGTATVLGRDLRRWGPEYYEQVGVSFELPNHYLKLTARENLAYFRALYAGRAEEPEALLEAVGLSDAADLRVDRFSKGMRVRLTVARALLHRPRLLFLDEPTSGLDPVSARRIIDLLRRKRDEGATIFLTTHNMAVAEELCDRVAFLVDGQIRLIDTPRALKLRYGQRRVRVEYGPEGRVESAEFPLDGLAENQRFLGLLRTGQVQTIHTRETTLERIFIDVTGRTLA